MRKSKGFTLIELLVVIAIIGLLSSIVVVGVNKARERGGDAKARGDITNLRTALQLYFDGQADPQYPPAVTDAANCPSTWISSTCPADLKTQGYVRSMPAAPTVPGAVYGYSYTRPTSTTFTLSATKNGAAFTSCNEIGC